MLHPVTWPNHGPHKELYLAEEAIGLVRSLDWEVARGPLWKEQEEEERQREKEEAKRIAESDGGTEQLTTEGTGIEKQRKTYSQRRSGMRFSHAKNA